MGRCPSDSEAITKKFIQMVDAGKARLRTYPNSQSGLRSREIQAYAIIPSFEQNRQV
jgi:hypothetical protein